MLNLDMREFEQATRRLGGAFDQIPFALANAMNDGVKATRAFLVENTWPSHVEVRNKRFIATALKTNFASKNNLTVEIYDALGRGHLALHAKGGVKPARSRLAIPTARVSRGASGVRASQRPANLKRKVVKKGLIFQAVGRGKASKLQLMFKLAPSARIKAAVPFAADFARIMARETRAAFPARLRQAMATRR